MATASIDRGVDLVFDGQCGFCTRAAGWIRRLDRRGRVRIHPSQGVGVLERFGLSEAAAHSAAWTFGSDGAGRTVGHEGAAAVAGALDAALGLRVFLPFYRLPGVRWVQDRVYRWVAEHRYLLRGVTPWCQEHPEDCPGVAGPASCSI